MNIKLAEKDVDEEHDTRCKVAIIEVDSMAIISNTQHDTLKQKEIPVVFNKVAGMKCKKKKTAQVL